jgi:Lrp/AsnC family leucine-responsive transcriptional regulator
MLKVRASSMRHLEAIIERLGQHGEMRTSIVLSSPLERRAIAAEQIEEDADADRGHVWGSDRRSVS